MPFNTRRLVLLSLLLTVVSSPVLAQQRPKKPASSREKYVLVQVGDELKVVNAKEVKELQKQIDQDHKDAVKAWSESKKAAAKAREKFTDKKPAKPKFKKLGGPYKSGSDADKALNKFRASQAKRQRPSPNSTWTVVQIGEERRAVLKSEVATLKKSVEAEHREATKEWTKAKAEAKKAKQPFDQERPTKASFKDLKKAFPSEEAAKEWVASGAK